MSLFIGNKHNAAKKHKKAIVTKYTTKLKYTIKSKKLTNKNVAKKAFSGVGNKVVIKVPKAKKKAYTTLFRKKGLSKKVKIKS